jgi:cytochrome c oxidase subunit 2
MQSALEPHGADAAVIAEIGWVLLVGAALIFAVVMALAAWAVLGRRRGWLASQRAVVGGGIVFPLLALSALLVYTLLAAARMSSSDAPPDLRIEVVGEQWWWRVRYTHADGRFDFATANEIHVPVDRDIEFVLRSGDVLHSLWVPALAGKLDLIPGKDNRLRVRARSVGVFRGQCAEYCGGPHAQMALHVVVETPERFEQWRIRQRAPASAPGDPLFRSRCAACHTVRGTTAAGELGPDLTHVGSRRWIGAGVLPNDPAAMKRWIGSGQHVKPGNLMPQFETFTDAELSALADYLESLR